MTRYDPRGYGHPTRDEWAYDQSMQSYGPGFDPGFGLNPYAEPAAAPTTGAPWGSLSTEGEPWESGVRKVYRLPEDDIATARSLSRNDGTWANGSVPLAERVPPQETGEAEEEHAEESAAEETDENGVPIARKPDYTDVSARVSTTPGKGARPDPFGRDDENMTRDERMKLAGEAYDKASAEPGTGQWEDEFTRYHKRPTDDDVDRSWQLQSLMWGNDQGMKFREMMRREQAGYEQGLEGARGKDYAGRRISKALAQSIVAARLATPEEAATLTHGDELVKTFTSGGYSQGSRAEALEQKYQTHMTDTDRKIAELESRERVAAERNRSNEDVARTYADRKRMEELPEEARAKLFAARVYRSHGLPEEVGVAAWNGDFSQVPPEALGDVKAALAEIKPFKKETALRPTGPGVAGSESRGEINTKQAIDKMIRSAQADPNKAYAIQSDMVETAGVLNQGITAWNNLSPQGQKDFVEYGSKGIGAVFANGLKDEKDRAIGQAVWTVLNELIQKRSGVAVTESEWGRTASEIGLGTGVWDPFNSTAGIENYLNNAARRMTNRYELYNRLLKWK